jgi:hypothetical protein
MATGWKVRGSNPGKGKRFFSSEKRPNRLWDSSRVLLSGYGFSFPTVKRTEREVNKSAPSSFEFKNKLSYISTPPIRLYSVDRDKYTILP